MANYPSHICNRILQELEQELSPGQHYQKYRKFELLGSGRYGQVYRGETSRERKNVAMKIIPLRPVHWELVYEVQNLKMCQSPYVISYVDSYKTQSQLVIVTEYVRGTTLYNIMRHVRLNEREVATVVGNVLRGLEELHRHSIIHRDLKGANILLAQDGCIKLADLGVSIRCESPARMKEKRDVKGYLMAPEVMNKDWYDSKADVWSLGMLIVQMINGRQSSLGAIFYLISEKEPLKILQVPIAADLHGFLARCLEIDATSRASVAELLGHEFLKKKGTPSTVQQLLCKFRNYAGLKASLLTSDFSK